jgi:Zn ribbon nucleic-acid-binding protein
MGEKKKENKNWFHCVNCGYKSSEEKLREGLYITDMTNNMKAVECPKCGLDQLIEK